MTRELLGAMSISDGVKLISHKEPVHLALAVKENLQGALKKPLCDDKGERFVVLQ
jgi:hypothetical protein